MFFTLTGGNNMNKQEMVNEIALNALIQNPKVIYDVWLGGEFKDVNQFIRLFDSLNKYEVDPECDEGDTIINVDEIDYNRDVFMEKLKTEKLI